MQAKRGMPWSQERMGPKGTWEQVGVEVVDEWVSHNLAVIIGN
jgi:hypothetical protein